MTRHARDLARLSDGARPPGVVDVHGVALECVDQLLDASALEPGSIRGDERYFVVAHGNDEKPLDIDAIPAQSVKLRVPRERVPERPWGVVMSGP